MNKVRLSIASCLALILAVLVAAPVFAWNASTCAHTTQYYIDHPSTTIGLMNPMGGKVCLSAPITTSNASAPCDIFADTSTSGAQSFLTFLNGNGNTDTHVASLEKEILTALLTLNCLENSYCDTYHSEVDANATAAINSGRSFLDYFNDHGNYGSTTTAEIDAWSSELDNFNNGKGALQSCGPTASFLSFGRVAYHGSLVTLSWRIATTEGIVGFNVYAGKLRLNHRLIAVHSSPLYRFSAPATHRSLSVGIVLRDGQQVSQPVG